MHAPDDDFRRRSWSRYWASGALTSLPEDFRANYDGEIRSFWHGRCADVPDGGRVLDVCTGNGAVALLVAEGLAAMGQTATITAVDLADIQPQRIRQRFPALAKYIDTIGFVGNQPFEAVALDDASQDLIVSQYGIEYCEPEPAARQCARLLKPGGRMALVTHATDSAMRATMQQELEQYEVLADSGLFQRAREWRSGSLGAEGFVRALARIDAVIRGRPDASGSPLFGYVLGLTGQVARWQAARLQAQRAAVIDAVVQLEDGRSRLDQMLGVHRLLESPERFAGHFEQAGLALDEHGPLTYRGTHAVGHRLLFSKPDDPGRD
ncbi:class I SAM-dependent methyltransferase [Wenzhouxiangella sp. XN79A]|uniref:class I SAM-dependent methyltransferase n=1 Tax=Wenzhouxiangella sp. XN79A TaxID=2724193 RepID=UPI00144AED3B|nr:class I SAM-dependent methyltransferase [Wenzhouxiangella sp. XN79A]NKI35017.1 class I SAM-dependent methyltransferase [Wenzhouxiangella sp. XN79A]